VYQASPLGVGPGDKASDWDTEVAEPIVISLPDDICYFVKTTTDNLVAQALHVTSLLYHFRSLTLSLVMRPNPSSLSVVVFPPITERLDSSHMCI